MHTYLFSTTLTFFSNWFVFIYIECAERIGYNKINNLDFNSVKLISENSLLFFSFFLFFFFSSDVLTSMQIQVWTACIKSPSTLQELRKQSCRQIKYNRRPPWVNLQRQKQKEHRPAPVMTSKDLPAAEIFSKHVRRLSRTFFGKPCSFIIRPEMFFCEVKWQNPDSGPFHHAEYRLLGMLFRHWQWQHLVSIRL